MNDPAPVERTGPRGTWTRRAEHLVHDPAAVTRTVMTITRRRTRSRYEQVLFATATSPSALLRRCLPPTRIHCIGDSHTRAYRYARHHLRRALLTTTVVRGATAWGLLSPNSRSQARSIFSDRLGRIHDDDIVVMHVGEVDVGVAMWRMAAARRRDPLELASIAQDRLFEFLVQHPHDRVIVSAVTPPTVLDYSIRDSTFDERFGLDVPWQERFDLTREWNQMLAQRCDRAGVVYLDCFRPVLLADGHVKPEFRPASPANHHLDERSFGRLLGTVALPESIARLPPHRR